MPGVGAKYKRTSIKACPLMRLYVLQAKKKFLAWANSEAGIDVSPDVDLFHSFSEVGGSKA